MGRDVLVESLRRTAAEDVEALWRDVRAQAQACRDEQSQALERQRVQDVQAAAALARQLDDEAQAGARHRALERRAQAALALASRLHDLAVAELPGLRVAGGPALFRALADELPRRDWQRVRVNPDDRALASALFPQAEVVGEADICGGLEVEAEAGRIRVSNTLQTRLAAAWPDVLPALVQDLLMEPHEPPTAP